MSPTVDFSTTVASVDPVTFGIPTNIQTANDRPTLDAHINFLLGRVGNLRQSFVQQGNAYAPGGSLFNFAANYPEIDVYVQDTWKPTAKLTVDAGLRWEAKLTPTNSDDLIRRPNLRVAVGETSSDTPAGNRVISTTAIGTISRPHSARRGCSTTTARA